MENIEKLKETFYQEADDILCNLDELLLQLEINPQDRETLDGIFRNMHTLKGSSGIFEFHSMERLAHACEDLLDFMRNEDIDGVGTEKMIEILFSGLDQIKDILSSIQAGKDPSEITYEGTIIQIRDILPGKEIQEVSDSPIRDPGVNKAFLRVLTPSQRDVLADAIRSGKVLYQISIALSKYCFYKGIDPLVLLRNLSTAGEILHVKCSIEHLPPLDELNTIMLYLDDIWLIFSTEDGIDIIKEICEFAFCVGDITVHPLTEEDIYSPPFIETDDQSTCEQKGSRTADDWEMEDTGRNQPYPMTVPAELKNIFFDFMEESNSYLEEIESSILRLEKEKEGLTVVNDIFRSFHTIKGNCGYLGFKDMGRVCHSVETLLDGIRSREINISKGIIDILLEAVDAVKKLRSGLPWTAREKFGLTENELNRYSQCDAIDVNPLVQKVEMFLTSESIMKEKKGSPKLGEILLASGTITEEQLHQALNLQERRLGEILVDEGIVPKEKVKVALDIQECQKSSLKTSAGAIKVDTEKVDNLVNLVGELVISHTLISQNPMFTQHSGQGLQKDLSQLGKITREIQDLVMSMRMVPLRQTFQKMMRVVRDVAKKSGKQVELIISGEETELDKTVIEEISDPLVHLLRNAVDHGIESSEERKLKGKPEKGVIYLNALHRGGSIVIEIRDDGRGLCKEKIVQKAREKGLLDETSEITDQQIYHLIFQPGFSTAEKVTDISGRGVGMDVVRKNIDKLRGHIDVKSTKGDGTSISITLPLTLAIIDGMVVQVGHEKYIIPTLSIRESYKPRKEEIITVHSRGEICNLRDSLIPLVRLSSLYHIESLHKDPWDALLVVVESDGIRSCIMVDELIGQQQVVIKPLGDAFKKVKGISGGAILGDGKVGLILDVRGMIELSTR